MFANFSYNVAPNADDNGGGGGGGGGGGNNNALPLGVVVPYAGYAAAPTDWLLCDGTEYRNDTIYEGLYNLIGFAFGVASTIQVQGGIGAYSYGATANTLTFNTTTANQFMKAGTIVRPSGFTVTTGQDINATYVLVTSAPAIGGTGVTTGTFVQPITGTGSGNATGSYNVNRASFAVPNMVSKFPLGAQFNGSPAIASTGGASTVVISADNLPQHRHGYNLAAGTGYASADGGNGNRASQVQNYTNGDQTVPNVGTTPVTNSAVNILNPYLSLYYIIHAKN
jgi:microcystin-dependent protein